MAERVFPWTGLGGVCALLLACGSSPAPSTESSGGKGGTQVAESGGAPSQGGSSGGAPPRGGDGGGGASSQGGDSGGSGGIGHSSECALAARGIAIYSTWDPLGYPLYALDGCRLAYVARDGSLHLMDLASGADQTLDTPENRPRRPTLAGPVLAWEVALDGRSQVRVHTNAGSFTLTGAFDHAAEPKASSDAVAFTAFSAESPSSDTDVLLYEVASESTKVALGGAGQQRFPDVSADLVAASDFSEDPRGYFDETSSVADLVLFSRTDGSVTRRPLPGKQAFPMLGKDGLLGYLHWGEVHPEPKFSAFSLYVGRANSTPESDTKLRDIHTDPSYVRPSLRGSVIDFIDSSGSNPTLYRAELAPLGEPVVAFQANTAAWLLSPTGTEGWTVFGKQTAGDYVLDVSAR